jgi:hypothetical protein
MEFMAELADAIPKDLFVSTFQDVKETILATDWESFQKKRTKDVAGVCLFIWDEMVHQGVTAEPSKIAPIVNNDFKGIAKFVRQELKKEPVTEAYAVSYYNEVDPKNSFVDVSLVRCWPNDIHISDVEFSDNRKPAHAGDKVKSSSQRNYHGLHVFGDFIIRLKNVAREKSIERISLMVAHKDLYEVFRRHGFQVSETKMAKLAFERVGIGFPMILSVN